METIKIIDNKTFISLGVYSSRKYAQVIGRKFLSFRTTEIKAKHNTKYYELYVHSKAWKTPAQLKMKNGETKII